MGTCILCSERTNRQCVDCRRNLCDVCGKFHSYCPKCGGTEFEYVYS